MATYNGGAIRYMLLTMLLLVFAKPLCAQNIQLSGVLRDAATNEHIINAYVVATHSQTATVSNSYGFFSLSVPKQTTPYKLIISNVAYDTDTLMLLANADTVLNIFLQAGKHLKEVVVSGDARRPIEQRNEMSVLAVPMRQIQLLPAFGGEQDIIKAYQLMPGVQSGNEGSSSLLVRGGSPDQNLMLIDGIPLYYVNHLGGFVSVFNNDAINSSRLYKGGFPARYGGRLSSVMDIRMKEGNSSRFGGSASLGLLSAKLMLQGPIKKHTSSYLISYRRMLYDLLMRPLSKMISKTTSVAYYFHDFNIKLNHKLSDKDQLYLSLYYGDDKIRMKYRDKQSQIENNSDYARKWGNIVTSLRWNHVFNPKLFANMSLAFTRYRFATQLATDMKSHKSEQKNWNTFFSGIYDYSFRYNFEYYISRVYTMRFGTQLTRHAFKPGATTYRAIYNGADVMNQTQSTQKTYAADALAYMEHELNWQHISFNLGLHYAVYNVKKDIYHHIEPRIMAKYQFLDRQALTVSYAKMHQNMHLLSSSGVGFPVDFWLPAVDKARPSVADQWAIGYAATLFSNIEINIEGFYKTMRHLTTFKAGASYFGTNQTWLDKIEAEGKGKVYGIDVLLSKHVGPVSGWLSYTWMKNYRQFANINAGLRYPYKYDRTHDFSIVLNYKIDKNIDVSVTWVYGTGQALTLPVAKYYLPIEYPGTEAMDYMQEIYHYTSKNGFRAKPYHRMDIGINFKKAKKWGERVWNLSIYNVYNQRNPFSYYFAPDENAHVLGETQTVKLYQQSLFPFIPSLSYSIKF